MITIPLNSTRQLNTTSRRNGEIVESTEQYPITYDWASSDETIATVDETGLITAVALGTCDITCILSQNPLISKITALEVLPAVSNELNWITPPPTEITAYQSASFEVAYYENGVPTSEIVTWDFSGAIEGSFSTSTEGNKITIHCFGAGGTLTVYANYDTYQLTADIELKGF